MCNCECNATSHLYKTTLRSSSLLTMTCSPGVLVQARVLAVAKFLGTKLAKAPAHKQPLHAQVCMGLCSREGLERVEGPWAVLSYNHPPIAPSHPDIATRQMPC
jgi:hypothetical protein